MIAHSIECNNPKCNNRLAVQIKKAESEPILFCSQNCFDSVLSLSEKASDNYNYENPEELKHLVKNLVTQTKRLQKEVESLRKIRKTYFGLFKNNILKDENYKRDWSFMPDDSS